MNINWTWVLEILRNRRNLFQIGPSLEGPAYRNEIELIFPTHDVDIEWQHKRSWEGGWGTEESYIFFLTIALSLESG